MISQTQKKGFTLIETIIYIGIVSSILLSMSYLIINIVGGQSSNNARSEVDYNMAEISRIMMKDFRAAKSISNLSSNAVTVETVGGRLIIYSFDDSSKSLSRTVDADPSVVLNTEQVSLTGQFVDLSYLGRSKNIGVTLDIAYKNPDNLNDYNASSTSEFAVELRGVK